MPASGTIAEAAITLTNFECLLRRSHSSSLSLLDLSLSLQATKLVQQGIARHAEVARGVRLVPVTGLECIEDEHALLADGSAKE